MKTLPRLNQTATFYPSSRVGDFGKLVLGLGITVRCRYDIKDGTYTDQRGMDVENTVGLHMNYNEAVKEGTFFILSNGLTYIVVERYHTPDLNGRYFKTYCKLKEHFAV